MNILPVALSFLIIFFGTVNLIRMAIFLVGSDIYSLKRHMRRNLKPTHFPSISIVIPAHNEEKSVLHAISSILHNSYPQEKVHVVVVDDGSEDRTSSVIVEYIKKHNLSNVTLITQSNMGKAHALNNGIKSTTSDLVMCLDADSYLEKNALKQAALYFENKNVVALAANIKIIKTSGVINLVQIFEYLISYQMKKAQTIYNIEYIIGGIGSTFRRNYLEKINYYDTNTVTEDIDLTMKILSHGNQDTRVVYGSDVVAYTESALRVSDLMRQRYRWKWGRYQTFLKNKSMFFSKDKKYTKGLCWVYLPYAFYSDLAFFFEPLLVFYIAYLVIRYQDITTFLTALCALIFYMGISILGEETLSKKYKTVMILCAPLMYFLFYVLSFVEYWALVKSFVNMPNLKSSLSNSHSTWKPIQRLGLSTTSITLEKPFNLELD